MKSRLLRYIRQSLAMKLSLGIVLLAIPVFIAAVGIFFVQSRYVIRKAAMQRADNVVSTATIGIERHLRAVETATNACVWQVQQHLQPDSLLVYTRSIVLLNSHVNGCSVTLEPGVFPQYGRYFSVYSVRQGDTVLTAREAPYEYFDKVWYRTPRDQKRDCWVEPFDDYNEGTLSATEPIASYCKPLYDAKHQLLGVIATDLALTSLSESISDNCPYEHSYYMLIGREGHYYIHPDTTRLFRQTIFTGLDPRADADLIALGHAMTAGNNGHMQVKIDGATCLVCYRQVPGTQWSLALVCPDDDILQSYHRMTHILIPLIAVGLLLILLLSVQAVKYAVRPLNKLVEQSKQIAHGNLDNTIPLSRRTEEVGSLQNSFRTMQESLRRQLTSIKQANAEAKRRNEELAHARQLAEEAARQKTAFIQNVTHQIRTPLNIIIGFAQVLRDSIGQIPEAEVRDVTSVMSHNAGTLSRMVLMLYDSSDTGITLALSTNHHEVVSCNDVARESIQYTYQHFPELKIHFTTELPDAFSIHTNRIYLMRTLREILYNSCKYSDGQHISLNIAATLTTVRFTFQDTGPGIPADHRQRIFDAFWKCNDLSEGLGLGLPLAKRHATHLGGSLTLDANYHEGCRLVIELPLE